MGYTHYWEHKKVNKNTYIKSVLDVLADINHALRLLPQYSETAGGHYNENPIIIKGGLGEGEPEFSRERIWFNGTDKDDMSHETFLFEFTGKKLDFAFCKTARKPYDFLVCVCILSLANRFEGFTFSSDGGYEDWKPAIDFYEHLFGELNPEVIKQIQK